MTSTRTVADIEHEALREIAQLLVERSPGFSLHHPHEVVSAVRATLAAQGPAPGTRVRAAGCLGSVVEPAQPMVRARLDGAETADFPLRFVHTV